MLIIMRLVVDLYNNSLAIILDKKRWLAKVVIRRKACINPRKLKRITTYIYPHLIFSQQQFLTLKP